MLIDRASLRRLEPIGGLSPQRLGELAGMCQSESYPIGTNVMGLPEIAGKLIYLLAGELKIVLLDGSMRLLVGGCDAANWPIGYKTVLPVSSKAITEIKLLRIDFETLDILMTWDELTSKKPAVSELPAPNAEIFDTRQLLASSLSRLPAAHIQELFECFQPQPVRHGQVIVREGDSGSDYFFIESGRCAVRRHVGGVDIEVAELKSGDVFGEEALLSAAPRNATVSMLSDGVLLKLSKPDFDRLMRAPLLQSISRDEAEQRVEVGRARWLDVRYPAEFSFDGLPGALNLPLNELRSAIGLLDRSFDYIVYCQSGRRSSAAAFLLSQQGISAFWLEGGVG